MTWQVVDGDAKNASCGTVCYVCLKNNNLSENVVGGMGKSDDSKAM
jgi:hypothetical protein